MGKLSKESKRKTLVRGKLFLIRPRMIPGVLQILVGIPPSDRTPRLLSSRSVKLPRRVHPVTCLSVDLRAESRFSVSGLVRAEMTRLASGLISQIDRSRRPTQSRKPLMFR